MHSFVAWLTSFRGSAHRIGRVLTRKCGPAIFALMAALASSTAAASSVTRESGRALVVRQTVTGPDQGMRSSVLARVGALAMTEHGFGVDDIGRQAGNALSVAQVNAINYGMGTRGQSELLSTARASLFSQVDAIRTSMQSAMRTRGVSTGAFSFAQDVFVSSNSGPVRKMLVWTATVDANGRARYADPLLVDADPRVLYVTYTPLRLAQDLPQDWAYPDAGKLKWVVLNNRSEIVTPWQEIDVAGLFDSPDALDIPGQATDEDAALKCLANAALTGCTLPAGAKDVQALLDEAAASVAVIDYLYRLTPEYLDVEDPPGSGAIKQVARTGFAFSQREYRYTSCTEIEYRNVGAFGMGLLKRATRATVKVGGPMRKTGQVTETAISPTRPFDLMVNNVPSSMIPSLDGLVIDPVAAAPTIVSTTQVPGILAIPNVVQVGATPPASTCNPQEPPDGDASACVRTEAAMTGFASPCECAYWFDEATKTMYINSWPAGGIGTRTVVRYPNWPSRAGAIYLESRRGTRVVSMCH